MSTIQNPGFISFNNLPVGFFALTTNTGHHVQNVFEVIPEWNCNIGYYFNAHIRAFVGYSFLYLNNVARPGTEIDRNINTQIPGIAGVGAPLVGPALPAFAFNGTDFWAQAVNFGLQLKF